MMNVKVTCDTGNQWVTGMNGTPGATRWQDARAAIAKAKGII